MSSVIARDFEENDVFVTRADLERHEVRRESPIQGIYRDSDVHSPPLPGDGLLLQQILNVLGFFDLSSLEHRGPDHAYIIAATLSWAGVTSLRYLPDPRFWDAAAIVVWSVLAPAAVQLPITTHALLMGGHVRVGFEDNLYLEQGVKAERNAQFVERTVNIARSLPREVATCRGAEDSRPPRRPALRRVAGC